MWKEHFLGGAQLQPNQPSQLVSGADIRFGTVAMSFMAAEVIAAPEGTGEVTIVVETEPVVEVTQVQSPETAEVCEEVEAPLVEADGEPEVEAVEAEAEPVEPEVVEPETPALVGKLINITNTTANYTVTEGVNTIGRAPGNTIQITGDAYVSGRHAEIKCEGNVCTLTDVGSTNGTLLNGTPLPKQEPQELKPGDEVAIGQGRYRFEA